MGAGCSGVLEAVKRVASSFEPGSGGYIAVFGSVAEGRCGPLSDVDLVVKGLGLEDAGRLVEAVEAATRRRVEVVFVERAGLPLLYEALARSVFVAGDYWAYVEDKWRVVVEWLDFVEAYERMHRAYRRRVLGGDRA